MFLKIAITYIFFLTVLTLLVFGNSLRLVPGFAAFGNMNAGELIAYATLLMIIPFYLKQLLYFKAVLVLIYTFTFSFVIGTMLFNFDLTALLYLIKLILVMLVGVYFALVLHNRYNGNLTKIVTKSINLYVVITFLAFILLILMPDSAKLWLTLKSYGINFKGDPHYGRLISLYFDPNFFGTVVVLPILLILQRLTKEFNFTLLFLFLFLFAALLLTQSRSGISLMFLSLFLLYFSSFIKFFFHWQLPKTIFYILIIGIIIALSFILIFDDFIFSIIERFTDIKDDPSAKSRLLSYEAGLKVLSEYWLTGVGVNYVPYVLNQNNAVKLDSSFLYLTLNLGIILATALFFTTAIYLTNLYHFTQTNLPAEDKDIFKTLLIYISTSFLWAGNFNLLVFFPYWLIPVFTIIGYIEILKNHEKV